MKFILECVDEELEDEDGEAQVTELSFTINITDFHTFPHFDAVCDLATVLESKYNATLDFTGREDSFGWSFYELATDKWDAILEEFKAFFVSNGYTVGKTQRERVQ